MNKLTKNLIIDISLLLTILSMMVLIGVAEEYTIQDLGTIRGGNSVYINDEVIGTGDGSAISNITVNQTVSNPIIPNSVISNIIDYSPPFIKVASPNGGENWARGTTYTIKWIHIGNTGSNVKIKLFSGSKYSRTISSSTSNDGSYSWKVPSSQNLGNDYKIKITSTSHPEEYADISDNSFIISDPYIIVTSPNGGENWYETYGDYSYYPIKWNSIGNTGSQVKVELIDASTSRRTIASSTSNDGSYGWYIPDDQPLGMFKISITSTSNHLYKDTSDDYFYIHHDDSGN